MQVPKLCSRLWPIRIDHFSLLGAESCSLCFMFEATGSPCAYHETGFSHQVEWFQLVHSFWMQPFLPRRVHCVGFVWVLVLGITL